MPNEGYQQVAAEEKRQRQIDRFYTDLGRLERRLYDITDDIKEPRMTQSQAKALLTLRVEFIRLYETILHNADPSSEPVDHWQDDYYGNIEALLSHIEAEIF